MEIKLKHVEIYILIFKKNLIYYKYQLKLLQFSILFFLLISIQTRKHFLDIINLQKRKPLIKKTQTVNPIVSLGKEVSDNREHRIQYNKMQQ